MTTPSFAKVAPAQGLKKISFKVLGAIPAGADIYVAGYATMPEAYGQHWYWGRPGHGANVTVVRDGHMLYRGRLDASPKTMATLSLPSAPLSKK